MSNYNVKLNETNTKLVEKFMEWGSPLNQAFVIDAISKLAERIVSNEADVLKQMENNFVSGPAWVQCAKDWQKCHSDRSDPQNQNADPEEPEAESTYFLFGSIACRNFEEMEFEEFCEYIETNGLDGALFEWSSGDAFELLSTYDGYTDYSMLTKEQFEIIQDHA